MKRAYSVEAVRAAEELALAHIPADELMRRAARGLARATLRLLAGRTSAIAGSRVVLLVGSGNNGGDALLAGAELAARGVRVEAVTIFERWHGPALDAFRAAGGRVLAVSGEAELARASRAVVDADIVIDGIVGIGGKGPVAEPAATLVRAVGSGSAFAIAVDVPSGVDADTGDVADPQAAFRADLTVTFACLKPGLATAPGRDWAGTVDIVDIGLGQYLPPVPQARVLQPGDLEEFIRPPGPMDHKYSRGVLGIIAGSRTYPGAGVLAVAGARYSGVGMVRFVDREDGVGRAVVAAYPDVVLQSEGPGDDLRIGAWVVGPGLGTDKDALKWLQRVLAADVPVLLDADALRLLKDSEEVKERVRARTERGVLTVLTPHYGEFSAAFGVVGPEGRIAATQAAAKRTGCLIVLKGSGTVVAGPRGAAYVDPVAAHELATAGSGDVLSGLVGGFLANRSARQGGTDSARCVAAAVYVHGLAARLAGVGQRPVVATDIVAHVPEAIAALRREG